VNQLVADLLSRPAVRAAREHLVSRDRETVDLQRRIAAIPSPTGAEGERADFVAARLRETGLAGVRTDRAGNVLAGLGDGPAPGIVVAAHLDTVFGSALDHTVQEAAGRLRGPGIGDNARGLAAMLTLARVMVEAPPAGRAITFVATVGEEGHGDLKGVKHLFEDPAFRPEAFIALDGAGIERVVHRALGSRRLRARFKGPGGHSWAAFGVPNPAHAVGVATAHIAEMPLPAQPRAAVSVVRMGGGNGLNTIPQEAWLELDIRAEAEPAVEQLFGGVTQALGRALDLVNRRRTAGTAPLNLNIEPLGHRPSGATDEKHRLVQAALAATRSLGFTPALATASTDANVAISRGVPGIALGAGGRGGDTHLPSEWFENTDGPVGILRALLVILAVCES
jgi:acetylornithine deacetylase/succinyl-diaminopimelate desuccinylase-like protein